MLFRRLRTAAVVLSVAAALVLCWGYAGDGVVWAHRWLPRCLVPDYRALSVKVHEGRVEFQWYTTTATAWVGSMPELLPPGMHLHGHFDYHPRIDLRTAIYGIEARPRVRTATDREYVVAAPIWCALVPCVIAPALWFRDRRRRRSAWSEGFTVAPAAVS